MRLPLGATVHRVGVCRSHQRLVSGLALGRISDCRSLQNRRFWCSRLADPTERVSASLISEHSDVHGRCPVQPPVQPPWTQPLDRAKSQSSQCPKLAQLHLRICVCHRYAESAGPYRRIPIDWEFPMADHRRNRSSASSAMPNWLSHLGRVTGPEPGPDRGKRLSP
jgi:hypothetical protein